MRTVRLFGFEIGFEMWCGVATFREWQLGAERLGTPFPALLAWLGPVHFSACRIG